MISLRYLLVLVLFVKVGNLSASLIGSGIFTEDIVVWRFYENTHGVFTPKLLLVNTGDSAFTVEVHIVDWEGKKAKPSLVTAKKLNPKEYIIATHSTLPSKQDYLSFLIDGKEVGFLDALYNEPPKGLKPLRYFSSECLNGREDEFWISKNTLVSNGPSDTLVIHLNYFDRAAYVKPGLQVLEIWQSEFLISYETIGISEVLKTETFDGKQLFTLPYQPESNASTQIDLQLVVSTIEKSEDILGVNTEFMIYQQLEDIGMKRANYESNPLDLPFLIIK